MTRTIAVVGVTGNQGSSVARTFLNEPGWVVRGITRDPSKPSAQKWKDHGVDLVTGDLDDLKSLRKAFSGAAVIYGSTDFWQHILNEDNHKLAASQGRTPNDLAYDYEVAQGKAIVDAAAANVETLERFILSTCSDSKKWSNGEIKWCLHFDAKAEAVKYCKETYPKLWKKTSLLQLAYFATNWKSLSGAPKKQDDGSFVVSLPLGGDVKMPIVDPGSDTGNCAKALVELPAGTHLVGAGSYISFKEWCEIFGKVNNVSCRFEEMTVDAFEEAMGPVFGLELGDMFRYFNKWGYMGGDPSVVFPWDVNVDIEYTPMEEYIKNEDWSSIL